MNSCIVNNIGHYRGDEFPVIDTTDSQTLSTEKYNEETCQQLVEDHQKLNEIINRRCVQNGDNNIVCYARQEGASSNGHSKWPHWLTGGGVATAFLYILRFIKKFKEVGEKAQEAGESIGYLARGLAVLNKEARALMDAFDGTLKNIRHLFGNTLPNIGRTLKYIFTFQWIKKQRPEEPSTETTLSTTTQGTRKERLQTNPFLKPVTISTDSIVGQPRRDVVLQQLKGLLENKNDFHNEGVLFDRLGSIGQVYLATLAINRWHKLLSDNEEIAKYYIEADTSPYYGKLPYGFIKDSAKKYLRRSMIEELRTAASKWEKDTARNIAQKVDPVPNNVENQLSSDKHFNKYPELIRYAARLGIYEWFLMNLDRRSQFIKGITRPPKSGELPVDFIRPFKEQLFRQENGLDRSIRLASIYSQLLEIKPALTRLEKQGFYIINTRAQRLLASWEWLSPFIQRIFGKIRNNNKLPYSFVELAKSSLNIGTAEREKITPAKIPWNYDNQTTITYKGVNLSLVMKILVEENSELAIYPKFLELRAKSLINDWERLPMPIKKAFFEEAEKRGVTIESLNIPITYIKLWHKINGGVGISDRLPIKIDDDPNSGGNGNSSNGGGQEINGFKELIPTSGGVQTSTHNMINNHIQQRNLMVGMINTPMRPASPTMQSWRGVTHMLNNYNMLRMPRCMTIL